MTRVITPTEAPRGGTALIVVPGVGDDAAGDTVGAMTRALLAALGPGAHGTPMTQRIVVPPLPGSSRHPVVHDVSCARLHRADTPAELVVYEMHWADLSRFPGTLRRFVLTLYGLLFQVSTIGIEAFRAEARTALPRSAIRAFSYLIAVLVLGLTAGAVILGVEFAAAARLTGRAQETAIAAVALALAIALAWYGDRFLRGNGWRFAASRFGIGRPGVAFAVVAAGVGVLPLLIHAREAEGTPFALAVHEVLWFGVRWMLPSAWALVGLAGILAAGVLLWVTWARDDRGGPFRANRTAVLSMVVSGLGLALLGALLVAAGLALTARVAGASTPVPCSAAREVGTDACRLGDYAAATFERSLRPLGVALVCAVALLAVIAVVGFRFASALVQSRWTGSAHLEPAAAVVSAALLALLVATLLGGDSPVAGAVAVGLVVLAVLALAAGWSGRFRPSPRRRPVRRGLDGLLSYLGAVTHATLLAGALVIAAIALLLVTPLTADASATLDDLSERLFGPLGAMAGGSGLDSPLQVSATVVAALAVAALVRTRLAVLARGLDIAYDVATYVRVPHGSPGGEPVEPPRRRVLRRYAALLDHVQRVQRPETIVIASHSQGSMYSLALLFGDEFRDRADRQEGENWPLAPRLLPDHPQVTREPAPAISTRLALLTAGCPILQTYAPSFPGQYEWPGDGDEVVAMLRRIGPNTTWRNLYRSGDYIGRGLWPGPDGCDVPSAAVRPARRDEFCLGPGQHSGYWADPRFARHVLALI